MSEKISPLCFLTLNVYKSNIYCQIVKLQSVHAEQDIACHGTPSQNHLNSSLIDSKSDWALSVMAIHLPNGE